ncbi:signal-induced proliferation-associated protein 1-like [Phaenicophaeus curvirostris]|uniref:signal-induced proliferation-associated protein 1-like n=1 Tax=Phaenicophaeus curvirostris TaxID=33595 RepID=UPI0037F0B768
MSPPIPGAPPDSSDRSPPPEPCPPLAPALRRSLSRLLSGPGEAQDEEWESISRLASACSAVMEALAGGGQQLRDPPLQQGSAPPEDESRSLSEKVSQLETLLKRLQEELQEGQDAQQRLRAEVRGLRRSNRRLQAEHEAAAARLNRVTRLLRPQGPPGAPPGAPPAAPARLAHAWAAPRSDSPARADDTQ